MSNDLYGLNQTWEVKNTTYQGLTGIHTESGLYVCSVPHEVATRIVADHNDIGRLSARTEAAEQQAARLMDALAPIMTFLVATDEMAGHQGNLKPGDVRSDKLANVNDVWLLRSDIARLSATLAAMQPAPAAEMQS